MTHVAHPILPPRIMRQQTLMISCLVRALMVVGMFTTFYLCALYLERVSGYDPITTGLAFLPQTVIVAIFSIAVTKRLIARFGSPPVMFLGMALVSAGPLVLAPGLRGTASYAPILLVAFILIGIGAGMSFMTLMQSAMAGVPDEDAGIASGLVNVSLQIGSAVGVAVLGTIVASRTHALDLAGQSFADATAGGFRLSFWVLTAAVPGLPEMLGRRCSHFELFPQGSCESRLAGDREADDERVDLTGSLVGVDGFGVGDEAGDVVFEQDAIAGE
jgi:predicted MFS family arabinose efflux permease